ncbi:MAG: MFS transporter [Pseudomonadota bacterium]
MSEAASGGAWSPFKIRTFRALWLATLASNIGTWMHDVGAGWLMTSLSPSPVMVALVQTATTLPIFLLAVPAGALADIIDRRKYLIVIQVWMAATAALLGFFALTDAVNAWLLVALTFAMGVGAAMMMPAWAAVAPEIVPKKELAAAIALNSMGINVARAIGPAVAGVIVSFAGTGAVFVLNALSYLAVIFVLARWPREVTASALPGERFFGALRAGLRFARHTAPLRAAIVRGTAFFLFASALWALLPLVAKSLVSGGPQSFGLLVASVGAGAVGGAFVLPKIRDHLSRDILVAGATVLYAASMAVTAFVDDLIILCAVMAFAGVAWIAVLSSLQVAAQMALPNWVRSRGLAVFMMLFMGSMALGSVAWGKLAEQLSISHSLATAAAGAIVAIGVTWRWKVSGIENVDLTPSMHWPTPLTHDAVSYDRGPVLITINYQVQPERVPTFLELMADLGEHRRRDGAFYWSVYEDTEAPSHFIEAFSVESWLEHLRQHERVTDEVRVLQNQVLETLMAGESPRVAHYVAPDKPGTVEHA